jgi:hypothetical protein
VVSHDEMRAALGDAVAHGDPTFSMADRLCRACVDLLSVDGAAISVMHEGANHGTMGSSSELSRLLDEFQFTYGEGPCLEAVRSGSPVMIDDLRDPAEERWPAYTDAASRLGVRAVFSLPVCAANSYIGALDLYRNTPGPLLGNALLGGLLAAELAVLPVLGLMSTGLGESPFADGSRAWGHLSELSRVEVYQATGMVIAQLDVTPAEALVRLRAHAFANDLTASQVAWAIIERKLVLESDRDPWAAGSGKGEAL